MAVAKITTGKSFRGVFRYVLRRDKEEPGRIIDGNVASTDPLDLAKQFDYIANRNQRVKKTVKHISIAFAPDDGEVSDALQRQVARDYLAARGYAGSQYIVVAHARSDHHHDHTHFHIVCNTVRLDGTWVDDAFERWQSQAVMRSIEQKYQLAPGASSWEIKRDRHAATRQTRRLDRLEANGGDLAAIEATIQSAIDRAVIDRPSMVTFVSRLEAADINPIPRITKNNIVRGLSYRLGDAVIRGCDLVAASYPALIERGVSADKPEDIARLVSLKAAYQNRPRCSTRVGNVDLHHDTNEIAEGAKDVISPPTSELIEIAITTGQDEAHNSRAIAHSSSVKPIPIRVETSNEWMLAMIQTIDDIPIPKRWEPIKSQNTDLDLLSAIENTRSRLAFPQNFRVGNYRIDLAAPAPGDIYNYQIAYKGKPSLSIRVRDGHQGWYGISQLIDRNSPYTLDAYERGLGNSLDRELKRLNIASQQHRSDESAEPVERMLLKLKAQNKSIAKPEPNVNGNNPVVPSDGELPQDLIAVSPPTIKVVTPQLVKPGNSVKPTVGDLRAAMHRRIASGSKKNFKEIEGAIAKLTATYQRQYATSELPPDSYSWHEIKVSHEALDLPTQRQKKHQQQRKPKRSLGFGTSM